MKKNVGSTDKIIRVILGIILGALYFMGILTGGLGIVALVVAVILIATSALSFCPLYAALGMSTHKEGM